jgi:hypothetical protein
MSKEIENTTQSTLTATNLLGVLFVGLKLTGYIDWSWWWVTCPFWIGFAILAAVLLFALFLAGGAAVLAYLFD